MAVELECDNCGEVFEDYESNVNEHNFCCRNCYKEWVVGENNPNYGNTWSEEQRERMSEKMTGKEGWSKGLTAEDDDRILSGEDHPDWEGGKRELECDWCGDEVYKYPSLVNEHNFCSTECFHKWHSEWISGENHPLYGEERSEEVKRAISEVNKGRSWEDIFGEERAKEMKKEFSRRFTGQKNHKWLGDELETRCSYCGASFRVHSKLDLEKKEHVFCSKECRREWLSEAMSGEGNHQWRGGASFEPYGTEFNEELKEQIRERDEYCCVLCGGSSDGRELSVHHIDRDKTNNSMSNLISLCRSCHQLVHNGDRTLTLYK
ncbi:MAG: hypothetical protein EF811_03460 [Methanonatronarchaeia archaeon]|nr:MAG: hypothetical protein EF811_03460 [Methanonatronarchaeia archaeon]